MKPVIPTIVLLVGIGGALSACGDETPQIPKGLLSAKVVGGTPFKNFYPHMGVAASCGLTNVELEGATTEKNTIGYRRKVDGHAEIVIIGAYKNPPVNTRLAFNDVAQKITSKPCNTPPFKTRRLHLEEVPDAFAFANSGSGTDFDTEKPWKSSVIRGYTYLGESLADTMVLVSIERRDGTDPDVTELGDLMQKQVKMTTATLASKA